jgi:hypothetical protein
MAYGDPVKFVGNNEKVSLAFLLSEDGPKADLVVLHEDGVQYEQDVARRAPSDYEKGGGGGRTWHKP